MFKKIRLCLNLLHYTTILLDIKKVYFTFVCHMKHVQFILDSFIIDLWLVLMCLCSVLNIEKTYGKFDCPVVIIITLHFDKLVATIRVICIVNSTHFFQNLKIVPIFWLPLCFIIDIKDKFLNRYKILSHKFNFRY